MDNKDGDMPASLRRFVSEKELDEARQRRQEEWEKARQSRPDLPAPDAADATSGKTLYEQLQLQKSKKEEEVAESRKFKNMIRGLDDEESEYLDTVSRKQMAVDRSRQKEQEELIKEMRKKAAAEAAVVPATTDGSAKSEKDTSKSSQPAPSAMSTLLKQAVKRKADSSSKGSETDAPAEKHPSSEETANKNDGSKSPTSNHHPIIKVIGVLPSIVSAYADSDDDGCEDSSDCSSNTSSSECSVTCDAKSASHGNNDEVASFRPSIAPALLRRLHRELQGGDGDC